MCRQPPAFEDASPSPARRGDTCSDIGASGTADLPREFLKQQQWVQALLITRRILQPAPSLLPPHTAECQPFIADWVASQLLLLWHSSGTQAVVMHACHHYTGLQGVSSCNIGIGLPYTQGTCRLHSLDRTAALGQACRLAHSSTGPGLQTGTQQHCPPTGS
jgi:hypothetical protein